MSDVVEPTLVEVLWAFWLLALVPLKARNLIDAWEDRRALRLLHAEERGETWPAAWVIADGTWWIDSAIAFVLLCLLGVSAIAIVLPPPPPVVITPPQQAAGLLLLATSLGLTIAIVSQFRMRRGWRAHQPALPDSAAALPEPPPHAEAPKVSE
jgi:hypothetical protein